MTLTPPSCYPALLAIYYRQSDRLRDVRRAELAEQQGHALNNAIIDSIPGTFYMLDDQGRYVRWNAYQRDEILGKPDHAIAGMPALDTIYPDDRAFIQEKIANVLDHGVVETVEGRVLLHGGPAFRWLVMTGRRMTIDGRYFLLGIGIDIAERKEAEAKLHLAAGVFTHAREGIVITTADGSIIEVNEAFTHITGYGREEVLGRNPRLLNKIDQSFVRDMLDDPEDLAIVQSVLGLAAAFRREAIAEGVETLEHGERLLQLGCERAQGYGIARPMPADEIPGWAAAWCPDPRWTDPPVVGRTD